MRAVPQTADVASAGIGPLGHRHGQTLDQMIAHCAAELAIWLDIR